MPRLAVSILKNKEKIIKTSEGDFKAKAVIIATGSERAKLGVPGEAEFTGKGVSYLCHL